MPPAATPRAEAPIDTLLSPVAVEPPRAAPPASAQERIRLTRELANQGRLSEALAAADALLRAERLNPVAHYLRAMILQEQGALLKAMEALRRAIYLDQEFIIAHFALGNLARAAGRLKEADRSFTNVLQLLDRQRQEDLLPESEGVTAGRLAEIVNSLRDEAPVP